MTSFSLQIVAMATMLCDHLASLMFDNNVIMRCIGRFAFPIYAFLLAEGFRHIKNDPKRVERHLGEYIILALVSEFCYDLTECKTLDIASLMESQNNIITLLLGFLGLIAIDRWNKTNKVYMWASIGLTAMANFLILSNYKLVGVLLVYAFYYYLNNYQSKNYAERFLSILVIFMVYIPIYHLARYNFCGLTEYVELLKGNNTWWYITHIPVAALLAAYNGQEGYKSKTYKMIYRSFYPAHLLILGLIRHLILKN